MATTCSATTPQARRKLGVVPQELVFDPFFNVREALRIQSGYFGVKNNDAWIDELLDSLGLADKASANMRQLSGGMKRRVLVAQALVHKPPVIVLDEPTAGVDVELRQTLWQFIARLNKQGSTVLLTTHYLEEAEALCSRIAMLKQGRVVALDRTSELLQGGRRATCCASRPTARCRGRSPQQGPHHRAHRATAGARTPTRSSSTWPPSARPGCDVEDVEMRKADLEDVFLDLMAGEQTPLEVADDGRRIGWHDAALQGNRCASGRSASRPSARRCSPPCCTC